MKIKYLLRSLFILLPVLSYAQPSYLIGTSQVGIEPDKSLISLHLAGYGSPKAGRFTLHWINKEQLSNVTALGGLADKLYIVTKNDLLWKYPMENNSEWKKAGKAENIRAIAGYNDRIYAVNNLGELMETKVSGVVKWKKIGFVDSSVTVLTVSDNKLFAANGKGSLWSADLSKTSIKWVG